MRDINIFDFFSRDTLNYHLTGNARIIYNILHRYITIFSSYIRSFLEIVLAIPFLVLIIVYKGLK